MQPETIGSIAYLSKFKDELIKKVICGFNLSCVGDERAYSYVSSPFENTLADKAIYSELVNLGALRNIHFLKEAQTKGNTAPQG